VETLVAAVVLVIGLGTLLGLVNGSLKATANPRAREGATNLARQILEDARTIPYGQISPSAIVGELQAMNGLADSSSAAGWQVMQRGITYTVSVSDCSIDDPKDGYGVHENKITKENPFCADSSTEGTATEDPQPEDLKRITVDVTWSAIGRSPDVHQVETLTAAGEAPGLSASGLHVELPTGYEVSTPVIATEPVSNSLTFAVTAPSSTAAMRWSLEGAVQTPEPVLKSGTTTWNFTWPIPQPGVPDGTYQVSAQAIDRTGVLGPPVSMSVTLIRGLPAAVSGLKGGFNEINVAGSPKQVVELQWKANNERNVIGYRIYNPRGELACPESAAVLSTALSCIDGLNAAKPAPSPNGSASERTYTAYPLYREAKGEVAQGPAATFTIAGNPLPAPPSVPRNLNAHKNADGSVTLTWEAPATGPVSFYRIYRESNNYTSRYDVSASTTYTDTDATVAHNYWVTAVGANLAESPFAGSVLQ
jgi:hypothetical protein